MSRQGPAELLAIPAAVLPLRAHDVVMNELPQRLHAGGGLNQQVPQFQGNDRGDLLMPGDCGEFAIRDFGEIETILQAEHGGLSPLDVWAPTMPGHTSATPRHPRH